MATHVFPILAPARRATPLLLLTSAVLGVVVALGFEAFETLSHDLRHLVWVDWAGAHPSSVVTIALATAGGVLVGLTLRMLPGHGGPHPAEHGEVMSAGVPDGRVVAGTLVAGFVALVAGASLGPEGALLPAAAGLGTLTARRVRLPEPMWQALAGACLAALIATMFGSPLAGAVPLLELAPAAGATLTALLLPSLVSSATAVLTLQMIGAEPAGFLQFGYDGFDRGDTVWAVLVGLAAGLVVTCFDRLVAAFRRLTERLDRRSVVLTTTVGGAVLGVLYAVGGDETRFTGIPELQLLVGSADTSAGAALSTGVKLVATAWCLAIGYRGGRIFPIAFVGGGVGLTLHLAWSAVPFDVAVAAGLAGAIAVGLRAPLTAGLIAAAVMGPSLLPLAVLAIVAAHTVHVLAGSLGGGDQEPVPSTSLE